MKALRGFVGSRSSAPPEPQPSTSAIFPRLRKLDLPSEQSLESPILTLTLSGPSFLDVVIKDEFSDSPLYIIETHRDRTSIYRSETENISGVAKVQWPSRSKMISANAVALSGISVQMHGGRWRPAEEFLKFGSLFTYVSPLDCLSHMPQSVTKHRLFVYSSRKFHIPRHSHSLKWKRVGGSYTVRGQFLPLVHYPYPAFLLPVQCTCSSVKGPLAILQTVYISSPPRLRVYSSLFREDDTTRNQPNYGGVPHVVLDYLVTTALLLVTDIEEYLQRPGQDIGASRSAMEPFLPSSLRNNRNGRGSYISTESRSPAGSNENVSSSNTLTDDARSINSEVPSTPCSTISPYHPYSFSHFSTLDPDVPPVPEIPPEHLASVPPVPSHSVVQSTLGRIPTVRRRLPQPPGQMTPLTPVRAQQLWGLSSAHSTPNLASSVDSPDSSMSAPLLLATPPQHSQHPRQTSEFSRSSMSINRRHLPPQRQPPQLPIPIPPKLRDDLARSIPPSATPSDGMLSSTSEISGQAGDTDSSIHEDGSVEGVGNGQPQEFLRRFSDMGDQSMIRASAYELPPPAYDAIDFSLPRSPVLDGEGYQSFSLNSRLPPEQIS